MRPYLAIIKDSFREALASRVLWILLALTTLLFAAILPFGRKTALSTKVTPRDMMREAELVARLSDARDPVAKHVFGLLSDKAKDRIKEFQDRKGNGRRGQMRLALVNSLNEIIESERLYDPDIWDADLDEEGQRLAERKSKLSEEELQHLNRLALESAFPRSIKKNQDDSVTLTYAVWDTGLPPLPKKQFDEALEQFIVTVTQFFVGVVGVFVAILVTASIIPNTFDAGSIYLLLSKPISRPLLYLTKFFGGCFFVLINAVYMVVGFWLAAGVRMDVWNHRLLFCIPILLFLFIIYYSVSGFAGLVWRNTVVCVVVAILFWAACFTVGTAKPIIDLFVHTPNRLRKIVPLPKAVVAVPNDGAINKWDDKEDQWIGVAPPEPRPPGPIFLNQDVGPIYDAANERLLLFRNNQIQLIDMTNESPLQPFGAIPDNVEAAVTESDGRVLVIGEANIYRIEDKLAQVKDAQNVFGFEIPAPKYENFKKVDWSGGGSFDWDAVAYNHSKNSLVFYGDGKLAIVEKYDSGYKTSTEKIVDQDEQRAVLATQGDHILLAFADGSIDVYSFDTLESRAEFQPFAQNQPKFAMASQNGSYLGAIYHSQQVWVYDTKNKKELTSSIKGQKKVTAAAFDGDNTLLVADRINRIRRYSLPSINVEKVMSPPRSVMENISFFAIDPIYYVFPKPGRLEETTSYLLTGKETTPLSPDNMDLSATQYKIDPWAPVWSSSAFVFVMLFWSCVYIYRQDY